MVDLSAYNPNAISSLKLANLNFISSIDVVNVAISNLTSINYIVESHKAIFSVLDKMFNNLEYLSSTILEELKEEKEFYSDDEFNSVPFLFAEYLTLPELRSLKKSWKEGKKEFVKNKVLSDLKDSNFERYLIERFGDDPIFNKRQDIIKDILWAHKAGKYNLSIPPSFSVIEGIIYEKYNDLVHPSSCIKCRTLLRGTARPILEKLKSNYNKNSSAMMDHYNSKISILLNMFSNERNPIHHGSKVVYGTEDLSACLLLMICSLYFN